MAINKEGPTPTSKLPVVTSISGQARVIVVTTVAGSLQTCTVPVSVLQGGDVNSLTALTDVSILNPTDNQGLVYSSAKSQWINTSVGNMRSVNNLSDVADIAAARANLDVLSSASLATAYASINIIQSTSLGHLKQVSISSATDSQVLAYSSATGEWHNRQLSTSDISGIGSYITSTSVASALVSYLTSVSAASGYASIGIFANSSIGILKQVSISAATDSQVLAYSSATGEWHNRQLATSDISGISSYLTSASAVTLISPYITSASVLTALTPYLTSVSAVTLLGSYLTSASAITGYASINHTHTLGSLSNVSIGVPLDGFVLAWSSTANQYTLQTPGTGGGGGATVLASLTDVSILTAADGQYLIYKSSDSKWHNMTPDILTSASIVTLVNTKLVPYLTSASAVTYVAAQLGPYLTSASAVTLIAPYITSASVLTVLGPYITSASVTTLLGTYLTSVSAQALINMPYYTLYGGL